jgi:hypothetical protein
MNEFKIGFKMGNLSDSLFLTPILKKYKNLRIEFVDDETNKNKINLFKNICNPVLSKNPCEDCPETKEKIHRSQRMLNALNIKDVNAIPYIKVEQEHIRWAEDFLSKYKNPVAYMPTNSCSWDKGNMFAQAKTFTQEMNEAFITELSKKYTILQFGLLNYYPRTKTQIKEYENVVNIPNLNLVQLSACYKVIGKGLFSDTGDPYLMIAVGGKVIEVVPMNLSYYPSWEYIYNDPFLWNGEEIRAKYFCMTEWQKALNYLDFNF